MCKAFPYGSFHWLSLYHVPGVASRIFHCGDITLFGHFSPSWTLTDVYKNAKRLQFLHLLVQNKMNFGDETNSICENPSLQYF
jgi:hypothetical protein